MEILILTQPAMFDVAPLAASAWKARLVARRYHRRVRGARIGMRADGPQQVQISVVAGLNEIGANVHLNPLWSPRRPIDLAVVLSTRAALNAAIRLKREGRIRRLLAGPNICVQPWELASVKHLETVNAYLHPSDWVKRYWDESNYTLPFSSHVWPAGVDVPTPCAPRADRPIHSLVLAKRPFAQMQLLLDFLRSCGRVEVLEYGKFARAAYLTLLQQSRRLVYLGGSESQGLALYEAWSCDVPTFVARCDATMLNGTKIACSAAPYLTQVCGAFFKDLEELKVLLTTNSRCDEFSPRQWVLTHGTNAHAARALLAIAESYD